MRKRTAKVARTSDGTVVRSGLEANLYEQVLAHCGSVSYEKQRIEYAIPQVYVPDIVLPNGIIVEGKGYFDEDDRRKHVEIKKSRPELDIRFVFMREGKLPGAKKMTLGGWCRKHNFKCAYGLIPDEWFTEKGRKLG